MTDFKEMFAGDRGVCLYLQKKLEACPRDLCSNFTVSEAQFRKENITTDLSLTRLFAAFFAISEPREVNAIVKQNCLEHNCKEPRCFVIPDVDVFWEVQFGDMKYSEFGDMKNIFGDEFADEYTTEFRELFFSWKDREKFENFLKQKVDQVLLSYNKEKKYLKHLITQKTAPLKSQEQELFCEVVFSQPPGHEFTLEEVNEKIERNVDPYEMLRGLSKRINKIIEDEFNLKGITTVAKRRVYRNF